MHLISYCEIFTIINDNYLDNILAFCLGIRSNKNRKKGQKEYSLRNHGLVSIFTLGSYRYLK